MPIGAVAWRLLPTLLLVVAAVADVRHRRIPNGVSAAILAAAFVHAAFAGEPLVGALLVAGGGMLLGLALWSPAYALRALGAGDVKLFAAAAAWLGPIAALEATVAVAIAGGLLAGVWAIRRQRRTLPYGVAIATGVLVVLWRPA